MNEAKADKVRNATDEQEESADETHSAEELDSSILLPAPSTVTNDDIDEYVDSEDEDYGEDATAENISQLYRDWIDEFDREDVQMVSMMMYDVFVMRLALPKTTSAEEVGQCLGIIGRTVR